MKRSFLDKTSHELDEWHRNSRAPGMIIRVIEDGKAVYTESVGVGHLGRQLPLTPDTIFGIMSITKSFTSTAIMQLAERGLVRLDDPVSTYLPYFHVQNDTRTEQITVRKLLSHTAGFSDDIWIASLQDRYLLRLMGQVPQYRPIVDKYPEEILDTIRSREDVTRYFSQFDLLYEPGQSWRYCTDAYVIAGDLIEKVSGQRWEDFLQSHIFDRLHLTRTFTDAEKFHHDQDQTAYYLLSGDSPFELPVPVNPICAPAGFIYSTVNDLSTYLIAHMNMDQSPLLKGESLREMQSMIADRGDETLSYGLGWKVRIHNGHKIVEHAGGYPGASSYVTMIPELGFGLIMFANSDQVAVQHLSERLVDYYLALHGTDRR